MQYTEQEIQSIYWIIKMVCGLLSCQKKYNRSSGSIINKLKNRNVYICQNYRYTQDDIDFLKMYYPTGDWETIMNRFKKKGVSKQSIITRMSTLKITMDSFYWNDDEINYLISNYETISDKT